MPRPSSEGLAQPRNWLRRNWLACSVVALVVVAATSALWRPWEHESPAPCGAGLTSAGTPPVCVGLDVDSVGFGDGPLGGLVDRLAEQNDRITGSFATVVLLDNMTPDPKQDSDDVQTLVHRVQGAMTAVRRANTTAVAGGTQQRIKLLLASYGSRGESWRQAVAAITKARGAERIAAVTGIGQSLGTTRQAVAALSAAGIATVGSVVTADNMNTDLHGKPTENFARVAPTNTDEAHALVSYLATHAYQKVMLVHDLNQQDSYTQTLASAFSTAYESTTTTRIAYTGPYRSPEQPLTGAKRDEYMTTRFADMHSDICALRPDVIMFAGRSADLVSFMKALSQGGACGIDSLDVVTGDDGSSIVGDALPSSEHLRFRVFFTGLAHGSQWDTSAAGSDLRRNYDAFTTAFTESGFPEADLADGHAMMSHDAALTAITAVRRDPLATSDPSTVGDYLLSVRCMNTVPGASGVIALGRDGNPTDKAMPILQIQQDGSLTQEDLAWPAGHPLDPMSTCG